MCPQSIRRWVSWCGAACASVLGLTAANAAPRAELALDAGWRFHFGEAEGVAGWLAAPADWQPVNLPHTWNARDGADGGNDYARGTGWYWRTLAVDPTWQGRRVFLQFDGASRRAEVFLNGQRLGEHVGGFARFRFDVTAALRWTGDNVLAVRVSNAADGTPPVSADFTFFGGLYRSVKLFATEPVHIDALDYASDGVYVAQQTVTADRAEVEVTVRLANDSAEPVHPVVRIRVCDAAGNEVASVEQPETLRPGARAKSLQRVIVVQPHRWNGRADPYRYTAIATVLVDGRVQDEVAAQIGLRSFRVDPQQGFFLNGTHLDLHGASRHQDRAGKGWAIGAAEDREDFEFLKEIGATALRVAHYPQSDRWFDLADENGFVVWAEIPVVNEVPATEAYATNAAQQLRELVRQHFNHPSICFWGVGNETREAGDVSGRETPNAPTADRVIVALNELAHVEDPTRLTTYASHHRGEDIRNFHTDVLGFNKYNGWYGGRADDLGGWLDQVHAKHPALRIALSEYGAGANVTQHTTDLTPPKPGGPWHPEEYQAYLHERQWSALAARPYIWGKFIWNLFDFASDGRSEGGAPGINDKGLVAYDRRIRKDAFYFYQANWRTDPVLHLAGRRFTPRTERHAEIKVYANVPEVEVLLNGKSCGVVRGADRIFRWQVDLADGENRIVARASTPAGELNDSCVWIVDTAGSSSAH